VNLGVHATATPAHGAVFDVEVTIGGLPTGASATLTFGSEKTGLLLTSDGRCRRHVRQGSCAVTAAAPTIHFKAIAAKSPTTLTFTVAPAGNLVETAPADNTLRVVLTR